MSLCYRTVLSALYAIAAAVPATVPTIARAENETMPKQNLVELAGIIRDSDSDLFLSGVIPAGTQYEERDNYFMDTDNRHLAQNNVIIRVRREGKSEYSTTVKVRPIAVDAVPPTFFNLKGFKCETDENIFGTSAMACSFKVSIQGPTVDERLRTGTLLWSLVSPLQIEFLNAVRPRVSASIPLHHYGPAKCRKWQFRNPGHENDLVLEEWKVGEKRLLELSARTPTENAETLRTQFFSLVQEYGVRFSDLQVSKTAFVLANSERCCTTP